MFTASVEELTAHLAQVTRYQRRIRFPRPTQDLIDAARCPGPKGVAGLVSHAIASYPTGSVVPRLTAHPYPVGP